MRGTKRLGQFDSNTDTNDSAFRSKSVMAGSFFDVHRAESSRQHSTAEPPLDVHRAQSACQHVRALNTQFASWVQSQLRDHPDELWEDGAQDYVAHANQIMEKFRDVVDWMKENAARTENTSIVSSNTTEKKLVPETKKNEVKLFQEKSGFTPSGSSPSFSTSWNSNLMSNSQIPVGFAPSGSTASFPTSRNSNFLSNCQAPVGFAPSGSTASFATSWNSSPMSNSQTSVVFGNQSSVALNREASDDLEGENDLEQPSSPSVKKTEEKGVILVHEVKCKLYVKSNDPADKDAWKDKGTGQLSIKCKEGVSKATKESKPTIVVRNDVGKVLLNALLYPGIKTNLQKNSIVAIFHTSGDVGGNDDGKSDNIVARTYLIRTKTEEERNMLATAIQEHAPGA